jgi:CRP-like cAMP-binding protein
MIETGNLKGVRIFDNLTEEELQSIVDICEEKKFEKGDTVIRQGGVDESISILAQGELQIEVEIPGFKDSIPVRAMEPKEVFGELAFISSSPRSATVKCLADALVINLERTMFEELCAKNPDIERKVMKNLSILLSERLRDTTIKMRDGISRLPSKVVSRKAKSVFIELSDWVNSMKGFSSV